MSRKRPCPTPCERTAMVYPTGSRSTRSIAEEVVTRLDAFLDSIELLLDRYIPEDSEEVSTEEVDLQTQSKDS